MTSAYSSERRTPGISWINTDLLDNKSSKTMSDQDKGSLTRLRSSLVQNKREMEDFDLSHLHVAYAETRHSTIAPHIPAN